MYKSKSFAFLALNCFIIISFLSACGSNTKSLPETTMMASLSEGFRTIAELESAAQEIVEIQVISQESMNYKDVPFTISTVSVKKSFKGNYKKGDTIRIIETGGEFTPVDKKGNPLPKVNMKLNDIPVLQPKAHEVIFLRPFNGPQVSGEVYVPLGAYQGRFKVNGSGELIQQAPEDDKIKDMNKAKLDDLPDIINNVH